MKVEFNLHATKVVRAIYNDRGSKASCMHVSKKLLGKDANLALITSTSVNLDVAK